MNLDKALKKQSGVNTFRESQDILVSVFNDSQSVGNVDTLIMGSQLSVQILGNRVAKSYLSNVAARERAKYPHMKNNIIKLVFYLCNYEAFSVGNEPLSFVRTMLAHDDDQLWRSICFDTMRFLLGDRDEETRTSTTLLISNLIRDVDTRCPGTKMSPEVSEWRDTLEYLMVGPIKERK
jgi:hypothetical protein